MTRTITIIGFVGFLVAGAAVAGILGQNSATSARGDRLAASPDGPKANRDSKMDKLPLLMASLPAAAETTEDNAPEPLRQAFASTETPAPFAQPRANAPVSIPQQQSALAPQSSAPAKSKVAAKPPQQKTYSLLSDVQIAGIRERLKLSASQEYYWPAVESALRAVARKIHTTRQANPNGPIIDPDSDEVAQLKSAAMPLLFQLREDQKREVRQLAHVIGLGAVASMI